MKIILIVVLIIISYSLFSQKHSYNLEDSTCFPTQKKHDFIIGDTIYVWARHDKQLWNDLYFYYSPLLDSLTVSLRKNQDISLVIKGYAAEVKGQYKQFELESKDGESFIWEKKWTLSRANTVKDYLIEKGARNCMLTFGMGGKNYNNRDPKDSYELECYNLVQILLVKANLNLCYSIKQNIPFIMQNIYFESRKWNILPKSYRELNMLSDYLVANPAKAVEISSHTDSTGQNEANIKLSEKRVELIKEYLIKKGVKNKIYTKGYASEKPIASNKTEEGRAKNRRIEVRIINNNQ